MNTFKHKIIILVCYYGDFPWYFKYFLHSCQFNQSVDFIIFSDSKTKLKLPHNVNVVNLTLNEINSIATSRLGFKTQIDSGYKLCDFKPAYGLLFSDFIRGYDFWGQCDIDVIYGQIRNFLNDDLLSQYDFFSVRHDYTTGCFGLYRNNPLMSNIFKETKDYFKVFSSEKHFCFDECNFAHTLLNRGKSIFEIQTEIETLTHIIKRADYSGRIKAFFDFIMLEGYPGKIRFENGRLIYNNKYEAMLYHLYWLKKIYNPGNNSRKVANRYRISGKRIYR